MTKVRLWQLLKFSFRLLSELLILYLALFIGFMALYSMDEGNGGPFDTGVLFLSGFLILRTIILATWNAWLLARKALEKGEDHSVPLAPENSKSRVMQWLRFLPQLISELAIFAMIIILGRMAIYNIIDGYSDAGNIIALCIYFILFLRVLYFFMLHGKKGVQV